MCLRVRVRGVFAALLFFGCAEGDASGSPPRPRSDPAYVADAACTACHRAEAEAWAGSHHDLAMQEATPASVLGDFDDATFGEGVDATRFFRRGDRFLLQTAARDGKRALFEVPYVFGVEPLQQLLIAFPGGRLQAFPIAWDSRPKRVGGQRWFHLTPDEIPRPGDPFHWTGVYQTWNHQCASCHSTALQRGFDPTSDGYATTWAEIDVGCQACHGGGREHVAWANDRGGRRAMAAVERERQLDACGPCHARRSELVADAVPGGPLLEGHLPATPVPPLYHVDGQIREEVYVLGSFLQSRMHAAGVVCSDCHEPHRATTREEGNALCLGCHGGAPPERFAARFERAVAYDSAEHHHHPPGSAGSRCLACHMPAQVYMGVDARRDHSFRIPRPGLSARLGTPDPCTTCHDDRSAEWAVGAFETWGIEPDDPGAFGSILAEGSAPAIAALVRSGDRPAIVRAAAIDILGRAETPPASAVEAAAADRDALVRAYAARTASALEPSRRASIIGPLLEDPVRAVRLEAARTLADVPTSDLREGTALRDELLGDWSLLLRSSADTPGAHLQRGELAERRGRDPQAHYRAALFLDPGLEPAARHAARDLAARDRRPGAEAILRRALEFNPGAGGLHYDLALLLAESGGAGEATTLLARAAELMPEDARVFYNLGLLLERQRRADEAEAALLSGLRVAPNDPDLLYALIAFHGNRGDPRRAVPFAERLVAVSPSAETEALLERLRGAASR